MVAEPSPDSTRWSVIAQLHDGKPDDAWDWFIRRYRGYVAALLRHLGLGASDAAAATEEFWSYLYKSRAVERADRNGRFRSFLSGVVRNYAKSWRRERGGLGESALHDGLLAVAADTRDEADLELWAIQILHLGLTRLAREHADEERTLRWFYGLPDEVGGDALPRVGGTEIASRLGCSPNAIHQALFRARNRLRSCIEKEIATTVGSSPDLRAELMLMLGIVERKQPGLVDLDGHPAGP